MELFTMTTSKFSSLVSVSLMQHRRLLQYSRLDRGVACWPSRPQTTTGASELSHPRSNLVLRPVQLTHPPWACPDNLWFYFRHRWGSEWLGCFILGESIVDRQRDWDRSCSDQDLITLTDCRGNAVYYAGCYVPPSMCCCWHHERATLQATMDFVYEHDPYSCANHISHRGILQCCGTQVRSRLRPSNN